MNGEKVAVQKGLLPDGRRINHVRTNEGKTIFNQELMFPLIEIIKRTQPPNVTVMTPADHQLANKFGTWEAIDVVNDKGEHATGWYTRFYGIYRRGFEIDLSLPFGEKITKIENGVARTFEVPNVEIALIHPNGSSTMVNLRETSGLAVFDGYKLKCDPKSRVVSVTDDFNPETDVSVQNAMRSREPAFVSAKGIPVRYKPAELGDPEAKRLMVLHDDEFKDRDSTGYHGFIAIPSPQTKTSSYVLLLESWSVERAVALVSTV